MIIWIYGEDTFRSRQKLKELTTSFKAKFDENGLNLVFFKEKISVDELFQAASSAPFMSKKKMIVVEGLSRCVKNKEWEKLAPLWKRVPEETIVVLWEDNETKNIDQAFTAMPKKDVFYYAYPLLSPAETQKWVINTAKEKSIKLSPSLAASLIQKIGQNIWRLNSELEKLKARSGGAPIKKEHLDELVDNQLEDNIFLFCDFLAQRKKAEAIKMLEKLINSGFNEIELLGKMIWQLKVILKVASFQQGNQASSQAMVAKELGLHPFVVKKISPAVNKFEIEFLKKLYQKVTDLDLGIKTGRINSRLGLELIISRL